MKSRASAAPPSAWPVSPTVQRASLSAAEVEYDRLVAGWRARWGVEAEALMCYAPAPCS